MLPDLPRFFLNRLISSEPWAREALTPHAGQTALLDLGSLILHFTVAEDGLLAAAAADATDTVTVRVPVDALGNLLDAPQELTRHAHIEGSAAFAETLARLLQHLRPDLAAWLAPYTGDVLAVRLAQGTSAVVRAAADSARRGEAFVEHLLREKLDSLPMRTEQEAFQQELTQLAADLDALRLRLDERLRK